MRVPEPQLIVRRAVDATINVIAGDRCHLCSGWRLAAAERRCRSALSEVRHPGSGDVVDIHLVDAVAAALSLIHAARTATDSAYVHEEILSALMLTRLALVGDIPQSEG